MRREREKTMRREREKTSRREREKIERRERARAATSSPQVVDSHASSPGPPPPLPSASPATSSLARRSRAVAPPAAGDAAGSATGEKRSMRPKTDAWSNCRAGNLVKLAVKVARWAVVKLWSNYRGQTVVKSVPNYKR
jgi:hypothetical protein